MRSTLWCLIWVSLLVCSGWGTSYADAVVTLCGTDTQAGAGTNLAAALKAGGHITFLCGGSATIVVTGSYQIGQTIELDGGGAVTLDMRGRGSSFWRGKNDPPGRLSLVNLTLTNGSAKVGSPAIVQGYLPTEIVSSVVRDSHFPIGLVDGPLEVEGSSFTDNDGTAVTVLYDRNCQVNIHKSQFLRNTAEIGAGLRTDCDSTIENSVFSNNDANAGSGGAIYLGHAFYGNPFLPKEPDLQTVTIHSVTFTSNVAQNGGGAIAVQAGPARRIVSIRHSSFSANQADHGGGIALGVRAVLPDSPGNRDIALQGDALVFLQNQAATDGGGIEAGFATIEISRCNFAENSAGHSGGAIYVGEQFSDRTSVLGNCLLVRNQSPDGAGYYGAGTRFINSTIAQNRGGVAAHFLILGTGQKSKEHVELQNTIVSGNGGENCQTVGSVDLGHNLQFPGRGCGGSITAADPRLDGMYVPVAGGAASGQGDPIACRNAPIFGRDIYGRRRGDLCAIGAAEANLDPVIFPQGPPPPGPIGGGGGAGGGGGCVGDHCGCSCLCNQCALP